MPAASRTGHRRGCGAASWRRPGRAVPRDPRRARAGVRRTPQLRQGAGAGGRTGFRDHRARRWPGHRLPRRLRQRTPGRRGMRRIRRVARDRARVRPQHHRRVGGGHGAGAVRGGRRPWAEGGAAGNSRRGSRRRQGADAAGRYVRRRRGGGDGASRPDRHRRGPLAGAVRSDRALPRQGIACRRRAVSGAQRRRRRDRRAGGHRTAAAATGAGAD